MRLVTTFGLAALSLATCQRVEEPAPVPPAAAATTATPSPPPPPPRAATGTASATAAKPCVVPLAEPPPPPAARAASCPPDNLSSPPVLKVGRVTFAEAPGAPSIEVEIADTPATERRGLMFRTELGADKGMIFVWTTDRPRSFWMQNTCIPLDMLFIAKDGTIAGILEQVPVLNESPRTVNCPVAHVLEVNAGFSRRHGIKPGMKVDISL